MTFALDLNLVLTMSAITLVAWIAKTLWRTSTVVERLDERTIQHDARIKALEAVAPARVAPEPPEVYDDSSTWAR